MWETEKKFLKIARDAILRLCRMSGLKSIWEMDHAVGEVLELIRREHRTLFEEASSFSVGTEKRAV